MPCMAWYEGRKAGEFELRVYEVATCCGCWVGEPVGELLANEDRSEPLKAN